MNEGSFINNNTLTHQQLQQRQHFYRNDSTVLVTTIITYHHKNFFQHSYHKKQKCPCSACPRTAVPVPHGHGTAVLGHAELGQFDCFLIFCDMNVEKKFLRW